MNRIITQAHVGTDGILKIDVPLGKAEANREVKVTIDPAPASPLSQVEWRDFVLATAGSIKDPSFVRHDQGAFEHREELP